MSSYSTDQEILSVHISRRDLDALIDVLKKAEQLCSSAAEGAKEFRMHRIRLEILKRSSVPPPPESTRLVKPRDLADLELKEKPSGFPK